MRLSELRGKTVIDIRDGTRLGIYLQPDAVIDPDEGRLISILVPVKGAFFQRYEASVPWNAIKRISDELVLVEAVEDTNQG